MHKFIVTLFVFLFFTSLAMAQNLTNAQLQTLKADILADPELNAHPNTPDGAFTIAALYGATAFPAFWVWRTSVSQAEITSVTTVDATTWNWTTYINRSQAERDAWRDMFGNGGLINFSLSNVRQGLQDIFSGAGGASQRTHVLTVGRRPANRIEKLFATGTGSTISPATMAFEGQLAYHDVLDVRALP